MNIKQLRLFHEIMLTGRVAQAAERLHISQPAASKMLAALEHHLGYKLFARQAGRLQPTPEATYLHRETLEVLEGVSRLEESFERAKYGQPDKLNIASIFAPAQLLLPQLMAAQYRNQPALQLGLQVLSPAQICEGVASGKYSLGLVDRKYRDKRYHSVDFSLPCYCALHSSHPAAKLAQLTPQDLVDTPWITFSPTTSIYKALKTSYSQAGLRVVQGIEVNGSLNAAALVAQNCGATLLDAVSLHYLEQCQPHPELVFKPFSPAISEPLSLISYSGQPLSRAAAELAAQVQAALTALCQKH
ncbi:MAG: LysR family transcriptional regulator [Pseudomonadales bacterium]